MKKPTFIKSIVVLALTQALLLPSAVLGQQANIHEHIYDQGTGKNSQVMKTIQTFTDVYGPRLTGSPQLKAAGEWAAKQMTDWGMKNAALEPWDFGHPGWVNERASGFITAPVKDSLVF